MPDYELLLSSFENLQTSKQIKTNKKSKQINKQLDKWLDRQINNKTNKLR